VDLDGDGNRDILSGSYSRMGEDMAGLFQVLWGQRGGKFKKAAELNGTDGKPLVSGLATLTSTTLPPGQQSGFRAEFPSVTTYTNVKFDPQGVASPPSSEPQPAAKPEATPPAAAVVDILQIPAFHSRCLGSPRKWTN